jgi:hypothetical protein
LCCKVPRVEFGKRDASAFLCRPCAQPFSMLFLGCPHHGKCDCDACGGRIKSITCKIRQCPECFATPPITDCASQVVALNAQYVLKDGAHDLYTRSRVSEVTKADVDAVEADREVGGRRRYPGSKMARCVVYDHKRGCIGFRRLWCLCLPCRERRWAECELAEFTGGEPTWLDEQPRRASRSTEESDDEDPDGLSLPENRDVAGLGVLRSGDVVVVRRDGDANFPYFLLRVTSEASVADGSEDDHGDTVEAGVPIVRGSFLTPDKLDRAGADSYTLDERTAAITAEQIALDSFSKQPILVPMGDGDHYELATVTHTSIMHRVTSVLV